MTLHIVDLWQYSVCCARSGVTQCTLFMVLCLCRMCRCGLQSSHRYTYAPPRCRTSKYRRAFIPLQCLCETILVTPYSMVWVCQFTRTGSMPFYWPSCSLPFCLPLFSLSLLSFYGLVLWGWGLPTDRVLIALSPPCTANRF